MQATLIDYGKEGRFIQIDNGVDVWEEPASDYEYIMNLSTGKSTYRNKKTRIEIEEQNV